MNVNAKKFRDAMGVSSRGIIHFNNAGVAPLMLAAKNKLQELNEDISLNGYFDGPVNWFAEYEDSRRVIAEFLGCQTEELSFMPNCATALSQAAFAFSYPEGSKIVTFEEEYPSNIYPWYSLAKQKKLNLKRIKFASYSELQEENLLQEIDQNTSMVAISWVQFQNGATCDLQKISARCRVVGAKLVVDAIQGVGVLPFDWKKHDIDVLCLGAHKWLCSPLGLGFMVSKKSLIPTMQPIFHGALNYGVPNEVIFSEREAHLDGKRFEPGSPFLGVVLATAAAVKFFKEIGISNVYEQANHLANILRTDLKKGGHLVYEPSLNKKYPTSPIVTFRPRMDLEVAKQIPQTNKISFAQRLDGIRISPHGYNLEEEIQKVVTLMNG